MPKRPSRRCGRSMLAALPVATKNWGKNSTIRSKITNAEPQPTGREDLQPPPTPWKYDPQSDTLWLKLTEPRGGCCCLSRFSRSMASCPARICRWRLLRWRRRVDLAAHGFVVTFDLPRDGPACGRCLRGCFVGGSALAGGWLCCFGLPVIALLLGLLFDGGDADDGRPEINYHPRFDIVESSLAAGVKTEVQIVLDVLVMLSPETADRKGGQLD